MFVNIILCAKMHLNKLLIIILYNTPWPIPIKYNGNQTKK